MVFLSNMKKITFEKIAFGDNLLRFSVVRKVFYAFLHHKKIIFILSGILAISGIFILNLTRLKHPSPNLNILLISINAARPDHFSCYGYSKKTSPTIDKLAEGGILFTQAIAQGSFTHSSPPSLITSLYPSTSGIYSWNRELLPNEQNILPQLARSKGYATAFICPHPIFKDSPEMFDLLKSPEPPTADKVVQQAVSFIENNQNKPFFLAAFYGCARYSGTGAAGKTGSAKSAGNGEICFPV